MSGASETSAIRLRGLSKSFGAVQANDRIDLEVRHGEILALLGENGSGKTTLMNMLSGIYQPDSGMIYLNERPVVIRSPRDAISLGIGMIHQHYKLVDVFTARENILLGSKRETLRDLDEIVRELSLNVRLDHKVYGMSVSEKQTVEIVKVLAKGAGILILDEPTAVLTPLEIEALFDILRRMRDAGKSVIMITHKLDEVLALSDRVTVLRKGKTVGTLKTADADRFSLTEWMVGRAVDLDIRRADVQAGERVLDVHRLSVMGADGRMLLDDISFELREGEILGVAGVAGSGQKELCEAIAGLQPVSGGAVLLDNSNIAGLSPREIIKRGVSMEFIPEDRLGMGLVGGMSIPDNLMLKKYRDQKTPILRRRQARREAARMLGELSIVTPSIHMPVRKLSGGNVQKVLLGREINASPRVLITAYPVRGLDINVSMTVYDMLNGQKKKGVAILYIGEDLDVLMSLCDRIMVLCGGRVTATVPAAYTTKAFLGMKMAGDERDEEEEDG
jgi:simple sugar transport system ATP-binding protein